MAYTVEFTKAALLEFRALDITTQRRIGRAIDGLAENPRPAGVTKLKGEENRYRIRIGDYRVIYDIAKRKLLVVVVRVRHRRGAYR